MDKAKVPYGNVIRQEIQLVPDPKNKAYLPWASVASLSGGRKAKTLFFAKWEDDESYNGSKTIANLPINENFKALARIYGGLGNGKFVTFDCPLQDVRTNLWYCRNKQIISSDMVCDSTEDCWDKSDEDATLCRGSNNKLIQISKCVNITILVIGYIVSVAYFSFVTCNERWSVVESGITREDVLCQRCRETTDLTDTDTSPWKPVQAATYFNDVFEVCKKFEDWNNARWGEAPKKEDFSKIVDKYKSLHKRAKKDKNCRKQLLMLMRFIKNLSLLDSFKYTCFEIINCLIALEHEELHSNEDPTSANRCIKKTLAGNWIVSDFVIRSKEQIDCISRRKRWIKEVFGLDCFNSTAVTLTLTLTVFLYLADTIMPYFDSHMDASLSITINHIEQFFITSDSKAKEISFIDLTITKYYYYLVSVFSSLVLAIFYMANLSVFKKSPESMFFSKSRFANTKLGKACVYFPVILPYHFLALEYAHNHYRRIKTKKEIKDVLEKMRLENNGHERSKNIDAFLKLETDLNNISDYASELNRIIIGSFIINLLAEGGPQLIVMTSLLLAECEVNVKVEINVMPY